MTEQEASKNHDCISRGYLLAIANKDGAYGYVSAHDIINAPCYSLQEPKTDLDKIRAEIEEQKSCKALNDDDLFWYKDGLNDAIEIIDKYRQGG